MFNSNEIFDTVITYKYPNSKKDIIDYDQAGLELLLNEGFNFDDTNIELYTLKQIFKVAFEKRHKPVINALLKNHKKPLKNLYTKQDIFENYCGDSLRILVDNDYIKINTYIANERLDFLSCLYKNDSKNITSFVDYYIKTIPNVLGANKKKIFANILFAYNLY